jgi:L-iditol 2-dehydrogenase
MKGAAAGLPGKIQILDFPEPEMGPGDVMLKTLACGICATDLKSVQKGSSDPQYALGHEIAGVVIEAGPQSGWKPGERVVAAPYLPCGNCSYCFAGQPTLCERLFQTYIYPGGLAEKVFVPSDLAKRGLIPLPSHLTDVHATLAEPLGCAIKGIEDARITPGQSVVVIGDGPMGVLSAAAARAYGAFPVILLGITSHRLDMARRHFADVVLDASQEDPVEVVRQYSGGRGVDVVIAAVSEGAVLETALRCVRPGGVVNAFAGVPDGTTIPLDVRKLHYRQYYLTGSFGTGPEHMAKAVHLLAHNKIDAAAVVTACFSFEQLNEALAYALQCTGLKAVVIFQD